MNDISTLVWFLITFIYIFLTKLKSEYIIIICIFFHLMCTYDSQVSQTGHFQFVYIFFLLYSIYPLLVFSNSIRDTTHHVVYDKGLEVIYSTVLLLLCSCFGRITPAPDNTIFTQVQWILKTTHMVLLSA